ncbi:MAG: SiaC family regulatory phosphoprotein [Sphingobacteriaceae bacterium]
MVIESDKSLPRIFFNKSTKEIEITGNLYHFKPELLFEMILNWLKLYFEHEGKLITIRFDLELISARSMQIICAFIKSIKLYRNCDVEVKVIWLINLGDEYYSVGVKLLKELMPINIKIQKKFT